MEQFDLNEEKILDSIGTTKEITFEIPNVYQKIEKENPKLIDEVKKTIEDVKNNFALDEEKSGNWLWKLIRLTLSSHSKNVTFDYLKNKYKATTKDILAKKIIQANLNASVVVGMISGATGGAFGIISGVPATFAELITLTNYQLKMIYELSVLYGKPVDLNNPEELYKILSIAFGMKANEVVNAAAVQLVKKGAGVAFDFIGRRAFLRPAQELFAKLGVVITQRVIKNIAAKAIPLIGSATGAVICAGLDYLSTQSVASNTILIYRTPKLMVEYFNLKNRITKSDKSSIEALVTGCLYMGNSDKIVDIHKLALIEHLVNSEFIGSDFEVSINNKIKITEEEFMKSIAAVSKKEHLESIYLALQLTALADKRISGNEKQILKTVAKKLGITVIEIDKSIGVLKRELFLI